MLPRAGTARRQKIGTCSVAADTVVEATMAVSPVPTAAETTRPSPREVAVHGTSPAGGFGLPGMGRIGITGITGIIGVEDQHHLPQVGRGCASGTCSSRGAVRAVMSHEEMTTVIRPDKSTTACPGEQSVTAGALKSAKA